uniref:DNA-(apurinic or apyrimidinic site) endonuclease n=1 Tax=Romanomermis culicivorax TaxID=13658 RepID=A0A915HRU6_ROMCU
MLHLVQQGTADATPFLHRHQNMFQNNVHPIFLLMSFKTHVIMKFLTWNVNGIRSLPNTLSNLLSSLDSDVVCLQETKLTRDALTSDVALIAGYNSYFSFCQKRAGYSGVATFVRNSHQPTAAQDVFVDTEDPHKHLRLKAAKQSADGKKPNHRPMHRSITTFFSENSNSSTSTKSSVLFNKERLNELQSEGRVVITKHKLKDQESGSIINLHVVNVYCPRNDPDRPERAQYQLDFLKLMEFSCRNIWGADKNNAIIILGDINCAHKTIDHCDPDLDFDSNPARIWLNNILIENIDDEIKIGSSDLKFIDGFRHFYPNEAKAYTCWDVRTFARQKNYGTRIDYILIDPKLARQNFVESVAHVTNFMGSDHCPVYIKLSNKLMTLSDDNRRLPDLCSINLPKFRGGKNFQQKLTNFFEFKERNVVIKRKKENPVDNEFQTEKRNTLDKNVGIIRM